MKAEVTLSPANIHVMSVPTWMNTINNDERNFGHIIDFAQVAGSLGYPFIVWNDMVYNCHEFDGSGEWMAVDTGWTRDDVDYFTAQHPNINRCIEFSQESW